MIGTSLNQYRITASVGAGGMGEVFRARDTRLNRDVAVKVLPKDFVADADRLRRFEQEAKTLAALNHPNVLTIHDAGVHDGAPYLVSELLEGKTLREEMQGGAVTVRKATDYALQIAQGLAAAHGRGVVHRDLKPDNLFVTRDGRVKILDFGLAKLREVTKSSDPDAPTVVEPAADHTEPGRVMGTPAYMAPEQVRGEVADHRADIFAFGCVLYEMLGGRRAFRRSTPVESMNAVLNDAPPELGTANPDIPAALTRIVHRCLEKQPDNRFQSAKDLAFALEATWEQGHPVRGNPPREPGLVWPQWRLAAGIAVLVLLAVGNGWWFMHQSGQPAKLAASPPSAVTVPATTSAAPATDVKSIAVLPFVNMSADKADEYLSDGMTEELLNVLAKIKGLRVPGRSSSFAFKGKNEDGIFRRVGELLNVQTVLEGSVRKAGDQLRITAQLINVADGFHLWSETYDRDMTNIFAIQSDIATRVAEALKVQLLGAVAPQKKPTENIEAYQLYLQGRQLWNRRTGETLQQAVKYFEESIAKDPGYALAYAGLADCYVSLPWYAGMPLREAMPKLRAAAAKALELDSSLADPHAALADAKANFDWDWSGAEAEFRRAIALDPNYSSARYWLVASVLRSLRRFDEALAEIKRAQELDPLSPIINLNVGESLSLVGQSDLAIQVLQKQIAWDPTFLQARKALGTVYYHAGKLPEAVTELETMHRLDAGRTYRSDALGFVYARAGRTNEARTILRQLQELQRQGRDYRVGIALVQHGFGDEEGALASLEQAAEDRAPGLTTVNYESFWNDLRPHPRAQAILKRMNLVK